VLALSFDLKPGALKGSNGEQVWNTRNLAHPG
jgi:hypothetical protein